MSLIVAVKSNFDAMQRGVHDQIRSTWAQPLRGRAHVKFFLGRTSQEIAGTPRSVHPTSENSYSPKSDEVILECRDEQEAMVWKVRAICKWMTDKMATHILLVDPACSLNPKYLWASQTQISDYAGYFHGGAPGDVNPQVLMGPGGASTMVHEAHAWANRNYLLSKKAATIISEKVPIQTRYIRGEYDDFWVGQILGPLAQQGDLLSMELEAGAIVCG